MRANKHGILRQNILETNVIDQCRDAASIRQHSIPASLCKICKNRRCTAVILSTEYVRQQTVKGQSVVRRGGNYGRRTPRKEPHQKPIYSVTPTHYTRDVRDVIGQGPPRARYHVKSCMLVAVERVPRGYKRERHEKFNYGVLKRKRGHKAAQGVKGDNRETPIYGSHTPYVLIGGMEIRREKGESGCLIRR